MREATTVSIDVRYLDAEPNRLTARTKRHDGDYTYNPEYEFKMYDSTAKLMSIKPDGGQSYPVRSNEGTRKAAKESVLELPFVDEVVMIE